MTSVNNMIWVGVFFLFFLLSYYHIASAAAHNTDLNLDTQLSSEPLRSQSSLCFGSQGKERSRNNSVTVEVYYSG